MTRSYVPTLLVLSALWGASYLFIKVALRGFEPTTMMLTRLTIASLVLVAVLWARGQLGEFRRAGIGAFALGLFNSALPFTLVAWGEKHVDSGSAAIANSTVPLFVAVLALRFNTGEIVAGARLVGLALGFGGVAWLAGFDPSGGWWAVAGTVAITLASLSYSIGALYGQHLVATTSGAVLATTGYTAGAILLLPLGLAQHPDHVPSWKPLAALVALALAGTVLPQLLWYRLLALHGSSRSTLVSYLIPGAALVYGAILLDEPLSVSKLGALALIVVGVALASGALGRVVTETG